MISTNHFLLSATTAFVLTSVVLASPTNFDSRIIGGDEAKIGQFGFQVGLDINFMGGKSTCGGALISPNYVLTAAHCVKIAGIESIDVHLGTLQMKDQTDGHKVVSVPKQNLKAHENYSPSLIINDIALIELPEKVEYSDTIQPIALPSYSDVALDLKGEFVVASGWGRYSDDLYQISPVLRYAEVRVEEQTVCEKYYNNLLPSMVCTSTNAGKGTCHGDSGGPLAYTGKDRQPIIVGLTSFGNGYQCVAARWPSVFTRITSFLDWISKTSGIEISP